MTSMERARLAAWVVAGDAPGVWWLLHREPPRFAARLLSAEEFAVAPQLAALVPHGINVPVPVHFHLGADVLVITDFIDPVRLAETDSPQQAILTGPMIEALHACQAAISQLAAVDPDFAPLAERAEQFLVDWRLVRPDGGALQLWQHGSGATVRVRRLDNGDVDATLLDLPPPALRYGWPTDLLRQRLERVAGERALHVDAGWTALRDETGEPLGIDAFRALAGLERRRLSWVTAERRREGGGPALGYAALRLADGHTRRFTTGVEIDSRSPLHLGARPLSEADVEAVLALLPGYGLAIALDLVAAFHFSWYEDAVEERVDPRRAPPLPRYPCEVEVVREGGVYPAIAFAPSDALGRYRLVIAPHGAPGSLRDSAALLPYDCLRLRRSQFHLPRHLESPSTSAEPSTA